MKLSNYSIPRTILIAVILMLFSACSGNMLSGRTFYFLDEPISYSPDFEPPNFVEEFRLKFISDDKFEIKPTLYADANGYRVIEENDEDKNERVLMFAYSFPGGNHVTSINSNETGVLSYKYKDGILEVPEFGLMEKIEMTDENDIRFYNYESDPLYHNSIVDLIGTNQAYERIKLGLKDFSDQENRLKDNGDKKYAGDYANIIRGFLSHRMKTEGANKQSGIEPSNLDPETRSQSDPSSENYRFFIGTKVFCSTDSIWCYRVTIADTSIIFETLPGSKNDKFPDKTKVQETKQGIIRDGNIITKDNGSGQELINEFRLANGMLYRAVEGGAENEYFECK
jgi:hypothetical protein